MLASTHEGHSCSLLHLSALLTVGGGPLEIILASMHEELAAHCFAFCVVADGGGALSGRHTCKHA